MFIIAWLVFRGVRNNGNVGSLIGPNDSEKFQVSFKIYRRTTEYTVPTPMSYIIIILTHNI